MRHPIYRAKIDYANYGDNFEINTGEYVIGFYWYQHTAIEHIIKWFNHEKGRYQNILVLPETLEISFNNGITWLNLDEFMDICAKCTNKKE